MGMHLGVQRQPCWCVEEVPGRQAPTRPWPGCSCGCPHASGGTVVPVVLGRGDGHPPCRSCLGLCSARVVGVEGLMPLSPINPLPPARQRRWGALGGTRVLLLGLQCHLVAGSRRAPASLPPFQPGPAGLLCGFSGDCGGTWLWGQQPLQEGVVPASKSVPAVGLLPGCRRQHFIAPVPAGLCVCPHQRPTSGGRDLGSPAGSAVLQRLASGRTGAGLCSLVPPAPTR